MTTTTTTTQAMRLTVGMDPDLDEADNWTSDDGSERYEFEDGSAIVMWGDGWDFGIHRDRLDDAAMAIAKSIDPNATEPVFTERDAFGDQFVHDCSHEALFAGTTGDLPGLRSSEDWHLPKKKEESTNV